MVKRPLTSAIRPLANLRVPLAGCAAPARHFSATPARGLSAIFAETENLKLNEALKVIQEKIILPAYLPQKQRELVFNPKKRNFIQQNPVVIELDGLEHKFSTINRFKDVPNSKKALLGALKLMETKEDWDNLGTLLAGYKKAGIRVHREHYARITRMAGRAKQTYAIIECAKQADKTGLVLDQKDCVVLLLANINKKITHPSGEADETLQALKWTNLVLDLLQRPEHLKEGVMPLDRLHFSPVVRGLVLFAQASAAQAQQAAEEPAGNDLQKPQHDDLQESVDFITAAWSRLGTDDLTNSPVLADLNPRAPRAKPNKPDTDISPNYYILALAQNIKGMELAEEMLGDAAKDLKPTREALEKHLQDFIAANQIYREGWADTYESVTGRRPDWPAAPTS
ncbi:hypothetical protein ACJ41O_004127 [Fusarium nematophilum]